MLGGGAVGGLRFVQAADDAQQERLVVVSLRQFLALDDDILLAAVKSALNRRERAARHAAEHAEIHDRLNTLSTRERQVLGSLVGGHPNKIIAFDLGISPRTVEIYRANAMTKMKASSLSDLVRMALVAGVLTDSPDSEP